MAKSGAAQSPIRVLAVSGEKVVLDATGKAAGKPMDITGSNVLVQGFEATGSGNQCADVTGSDVILCQIDAHDCVSHGIQLGGARIWAEGNTIRTMCWSRKTWPLGFQQRIRAKWQERGGVHDRRRILRWLGSSTPLRHDSQQHWRILQSRILGCWFRRQWRTCGCLHCAQYVLGK